MSEDRIMAIRGSSECPVHSGPDAWYDPGCRGCLAARLERTEQYASRQADARIAAEHELEQAFRMFGAAIASAGGKLTIPDSFMAEDWTVKRTEGAFDTTIFEARPTKNGSPV